MSALTIDQLFLTAFVELGLGLIAYVGFCKIVPRIKIKAEHRLIYNRWFTTSSNPLVWVFRPNKLGVVYGKPSGQKVFLTKTPPMYIKTNIFYLFLQGGVLLLAQLLPTVILLTSVGWKLPFLQNLYYNLVFATANGAPDGAHITSYLCVMIITLFVTWETRDVFLGVLSGALLVGLHEGIWILFYYAAYFPYITPSMTTNIIKDWPIFTGMIVLFVYAFTKYPFNHWKLSQFKIPISIYIAYVALWYYVPKLVFGYANWLPIRTANLPGSVITFTQFNETIYFWNPYVNGIEIFSWLILFAGLLIIIARTKIPLKEPERISMVQ